MITEDTAAPVILIVDDDIHVLKTLRLLIEDFGMQTREAERVSEAMEILKREPIDLILTDLIMPEIDGLEFVDMVRRHYPTIPIAVLSAYGKPSDTVVALTRGAYNFVTKPFSMKDIQVIVEKGLRLRKLTLNTDILNHYVTNRCSFCIPSDANLFPAVIYYMLKECQWRGIEDDTKLTTISICLEELLSNAHIHGNSGSEKRTITLTAEFNPHVLCITVKDEGAGFDHQDVMASLQSINIQKMKGKGLFIVSNNADTMTFNDAGNEVSVTLTMT